MVFQLEKLFVFTLIKVRNSFELIYEMSFHKYLQPATEEKIQKNSHKDVNILILGIQGVGKSSKKFQFFKLFRD